MAPLKTKFEVLITRFCSETSGTPPGHQKRSLAELIEYFDNKVSGEKIESKANREFLEIPLSLY